MIRVAWHPLYNHSLPTGHRFPMEKYDLLPEQLRYEGTLTPEHFFSPEPVDEETILLTHDRTWWEKLKTQTLTRQEERATGFPLSEELVQREITIMGGTVEAARCALKEGAALNIAGGTHHASSDKGSGFCLLNDNAIGANYLLHHGLAEKILIVDLDVHQGDGTAQIFEDEPRVFTFSMHGASNFPMAKQLSDRDIPLPDGTGDGEYLKILKEQLEELMAEVKPDFVFFQSGVDVLASDKLGRLSLSLEGCRQRDESVFRACRDRGIPIVASMGGGYSERVADVVEAHANTFRLAAMLFD